MSYRRHLNRRAKVLRITQGQASSGGVNHEERTLYEDMPCRLWRRSASEREAQGRDAEVILFGVLFEPQYDVKNTDEFVVDSERYRMLTVYGPRRSGPTVHHIEADALLIQ